MWTRQIEQGPYGGGTEVLYRYTTGHESVSSLNTQSQAIIASKVAQRQFGKVTRTSIDDAVALGLYAYWRQDIPRNASPNVTWRTASALLFATRLFFDQRPELRHEKYETLRQLSARWWWITKSRYVQFNPLLRLTFLANTVRLWLAARIAKVRYGDAHWVLE